MYVEWCYDLIYIVRVLFQSFGGDGDMLGKRRDWRFLLSFKRRGSSGVELWLESRYKVVMYGVYFEEKVSGIC